MIGTGGIGRPDGALAAGIGMRVLAWNRSGVKGDLPCEAVPLDDVFASADVVSLHLVLNDRDEGFLDASGSGG